MKLPAKGDSIEIIFYFFSTTPIRRRAHGIPCVNCLLYLRFFMSPLRVCLGDQNQMQRHVHLSKVKPRSSKAPDDKLQIRSIKRVNRKCRDARLGATDPVQHLSFSPPYSTSIIFLIVCQISDRTIIISKCGGGWEFEMGAS